MTVDRTDGRAPFYARLALTGLGLYILGMVMIGIAAALSDELGEVIPFLAINIAFAVVAAFLILKFRGWGYVVGALIALLGLAFFSRDIPVRLGSPDAFFDFAAALLAFVGLTMALVASVVVFVQHRRREPRYVGRSAERHALAGILVVVGALAVLSAVLTIAGQDSVSAGDKEGALAVDMKKTEFRPETLEGRAGGPLKIVVKKL